MFFFCFFIFFFFCRIYRKPEKSSRREKILITIEEAPVKTRPKSPTGEQCALSAAKMAILYFVYYAAFETPSHLYRIDNNYKIFDRRRWKQSAFDYIRRRKFSTLSFSFFFYHRFSTLMAKVKGRDIELTIEFFERLRAFLRSNLENFFFLSSSRFSNRFVKIDYYISIEI